MISLKINNNSVEVSAGTTVLDAACKLDIKIPTLCHDPRLKPYGGCRLCIVEVKGEDKPVAACVALAEEGMQVTTESKKLYDLRKTTVELLLSDHPDDCMLCTRAGDCTLQDLAYQYQIRENRFSGATRNNKKRKDNNPFVEREDAKCILCGLCARVCHEMQGVGAIDYIGRGFETKIGPPFDKDLDCEFCGQCVAVCPTGALTGKDWAGKARQQDVKQTDTTCSYCGCGCSLTIHSKDDQVVRVSSKPDTPNQGWLCVKGRFGYEFINKDDRLQTPYIRREKGSELEPASWDEALDFVASRLSQIKKEHGPDAIGGLSSARCTNEENYLFQKFFRTQIGTNNVDHCARY